MSLFKFDIFYNLLDDVNVSDKQIIAYALSCNNPNINLTYDYTLGISYDSGYKIVQIYWTAYSNINTTSCRTIALCPLTMRQFESLKNYVYPEYHFSQSEMIGPTGLIFALKNRYATQVKT